MVIIITKKCACDTQKASCTVMKTLSLKLNDLIVIYEDKDKRQF
jgi:hypothetical protein